MTAVLDLDANVVELVACPAHVPSPLREITFRANAWLPDEDARLRAMFAADDAIGDMATTLGRGLHAVRARIDLLGLRLDMVRTMSDSTSERVIKLRR